MWVRRHPGVTWEADNMEDHVLAAGIFAIVSDQIADARKAYEERYEWQKPAQQPGPEIAPNSKPVFVAVTGYDHRASLPMRVSQTIPKLKLNIDEGHVAVEIGRPTDKHVAELMKKELQEHEGPRRVFFFHPVWQEEAPSRHQGIEVSVTALHFSKNEVDFLSTLKEDDSHLVLCVVPQSAHVQDMKVVPSAPEECVVQGDSRPAFMALTWEQLEDRDATVIVGRRSATEWLVGRNVAGEKRKRDCENARPASP